MIDRCFSRRRAYHKLSIGLEDRCPDKSTPTRTIPLEPAQLKSILKSAPKHGGYGPSYPHPVPPCPVHGISLRFPSRQIGGGNLPDKRNSHRSMISADLPRSHRRRWGKS